MQQSKEMQQVEQRTPEWFKMREGRFTASQISRLLGGIKKDGTLLGKTEQSILNYAHEKAIETLYGSEPEMEYLPADMQRGVDLEPLAFKLFSELERFEFDSVKECGFYPHGEHSGSSPDGLVGETSILEIKCPQRAKFFKYVPNGFDEIDIKYIAQMQMQMLATDTGLCYFMNYIIDKGVERWHIIEVPRDDEFINFMEGRIEFATLKKLEIINRINENKQF